MNYKLSEHKLVVTVLELTQIKVEAKGTVKKPNVDQPAGGPLPGVEAGGPRRWGNPVITVGSGK